MRLWRQIIFEIRHINVSGTKKKCLATGVCVVFVLFFLSVTFLHFFPFNKSSLPTREPLILVYHDIRESSEHTGSSEYVTPEVFEQQMKYLAENGFAVMSLSAAQTTNSDTWRTVVLTFDDTWKNQYTVALPIVRRYGFGATFFINSSWVDDSPFLTWNEVRSIAEIDGVEIGGHTSTHLHLLGEAREKIQEEITDDKKHIEKEIGTSIETFAYPYGEYDKTILAVVKKAGYGFARTANAPDQKNPDSLLLPAQIVPNNFEAFVKIVSKVDYRKERNYWEKMIDALGKDEAYMALRKQYAKAPQSLAHNSAHVFGEALYKKGGVPFLITCDNSFVFGCYHGFLGTIISERGLEVLPELDAVCNESGNERLGCHHGIGHGIMSYFGDQELVGALEACASLSFKGPVGGCSGGLFMEYNFRNAHLESGDATYVRPYTGDPYEPCTTLPEKFSAACFYEQPDWWRRIFKEDYRKLGELCSAVENVTNREFCFIGTGRMAAQSMQYDKEKTIRECALMPSIDATALCRAGGFLSIFDHTGTKSSLDICTGLPFSQAQRCIEKAQLFYALRIYFTPR